MNKWARLILIVFMLTYSLLISGFSLQTIQEPLDEWTLVSQFGGNTQSVAISGNIAFAGIGLRMNIIDISDPLQPKLLGMSDTFADMIQDIAIEDNIAYLAAGKAGLIIVDVSNPANPTTSGTWNSYGFVESVDVSNDIAVVANGPKGVSIIDLSNLSSPKELSSAFLGNYAFDVAILEDTAFIAAGEAGLLVLDIAEPSFSKEIARFDTSGYAYDLVLSGNYVYVADGWEGVQIFNISYPALPYWAGQVATSGWALGVSVSEDRLISSNGGAGIDLFELTNHTKPVLRSTYLKESTEGDTLARKVTLSGDLVVIADSINGIRLLDISDLEHPHQQGIFSLMSYARRLTLAGDHAYVATASEGSMVAVNIADPLRPYQVSKFQADGIAVDVVINGNYATLGTFEDSSNCYTVIDISDPTDTPLASALGIQSLICGAPRQMAARGDFVYSADEWGLSIYDLSNPKKITTAGRIELQQEGDQTVALFISGNYAYVGDASTGLKIVNISDPFNPKFIRTYSPGEVVGSIFISEDILYIGQYGEGILTAKNNPSGETPSLLGKYKTRSSVEEATVKDGILVASEGSGGLEILDVTDPQNIDFVQYLQIPGFAWASVITDDYIFTAAGAAGVLIFHKGPVTQTASSGKPTTYPQITFRSIDKGPGAEEPRYPESVSEATSAVVCMVDATADSGEGSLRMCLESIPPGGTILFNPVIFPPDQPATIYLEEQLPQILNNSITVDASNAGVILDGQQKVQSGLIVSSAYNKVMGIQFVNFPMDGILVDFPSQYNQIGGDHSIGEGPSGQGNVFSNNFNGIRVLYSRYNKILGNFIGTNAQGTQAVGFNPIGISLNNFATYNTIGGALEGEKNIISNNDRGVDIASNSAMYNRVAGNYIGTDVTGTRAIPNTSWGVLIEVGGRNNIVGGTTPSERNIISGNVNGVTISDYGSTQNSVIGNFIGLDVSGKVPLPNRDGAGIFQSAYNRIGGTTPGESNLISGNTYGAIRFFGIGSVHAILLGNKIGTDSTGKLVIPNGYGLLVDGGTHSMIGGMGKQSANTFANNEIGIHIQYAGTRNNWVAGNSINNCSQAALLIDSHASGNFLVRNSILNSAFGIVIDQSENNPILANSLSANIPVGIELRAGGNLELSSPVLDQVSSSRVSGSTCSYCSVEVFSVLQDQGLLFEGSIIADAEGAFIFTGALRGVLVTTTATDQKGNTSPYSQPLPLQ